MRLLQSQCLILKLVVAILFSSFLGAASFAATDLSITGKVIDAAGNPIPRAVVMVYHAGPKSGYGIYCPTCYPDCGKRAITDSSGRFDIRHLHSDLWFELFVEKDGYKPDFIDRLVPSPTAHATATLARLQSVNNPRLLFRGRLIDSHGLAVPDAVVRPIGALLPNGEATYTFSVMAEGVDPIAITSDQGDFQIAYRRPPQHSASSVAPSIPTPPVKILVSVEPRGLAQEFSVVPAGLQWRTITVTDGGVIRGKLVQNGKPVGDAEIGLIGDPPEGWGAGLQPVGNPYTEITIGTQADGTFAIPNVPAPWDWYIYATMDSVAKRGATGEIKCAIKRNDQIVDLGDLQLKPAYQLRGKVALSDGKALPRGITVTLSSDLVRDSQKTTLPPDGHFDFVGLADGTYDVYASVKGYSLPQMPPVSVEGKDVDNFLITLHPKPSPAKTTATPKN